MEVRRTVAGMVAAGMVAAGGLMLVQPAQARGESSGCSWLAAPDGLTWTREVIPPRPVEGRANRAFQRSGLWQFIVRGAAAEGLSPAEAADAEGLTLFELMVAAHEGWLSVDAMETTDPGAETGVEAAGRVGDRIVCWRPLTPEEADLDGEPGGEAAPAWYAWFSNNPVRR